MVSEKSPSVATSAGAMMCSASPLAAAAGVKALQEGGNAFDAAVAIAATECVTIPAMCSLGGEVFALLYHAKTGQLWGLNSSGAAPSTATAEFFRSKGYQRMPLDGPLAAAVPGEIAAYEAILQKFGTQPLSRLLEPAIGHAENGFPLPPKASRYFQREAERLARSPSARAVFLNKSGETYQAGDTLVQRELAESLRRVADGGAEEFYRGSLARQIAKGIRDTGGLLSLDDLASHRADLYSPPLSTTYRGHTVYQTALPSQGLIMLEMLNILEEFDLASLGHNSPESIHLMVEAKKLAFADRNAYVGDPRFVRVPLEELLSKEFAAKRRRLIDPDSAESHVPPGPLPEQMGDTSYFCVVDADGNAVSFIHSISYPFGCVFMPEGTGILLNNRVGRGFSLQAGHPNVIAPGKKSMNTLNAYMVFENGGPCIIGGTPGGDFQPQGNVQIVTALLDYSMDPQEAVGAPRWCSLPGTDPETIDAPLQLQVEPGMPQDTVTGLEARGHRVVRFAEGISHGIVQLIQVNPQTGARLGVSDARGDGVAVGE